MAMSVIQVRLPDRIIKGINNLVKKGFYNTKSDVIRDAVRKLIKRDHDIDKLIGIIPNTGDSVKEVREIRKKLSKEVNNYKDIEEWNKIIDEINKLDFD